MLEWLESLAESISVFVETTVQPVADFLAGYVWNWPPQAPLLAIILLGAGLFITVRLMFVQLRGFKHAVNIARGKFDNPEDEGDIKHYQALTTALSATVGIGNIAGVALAIRLGGPGALFWMWVTAFFGMALKFAECTLAIKYRKVHKDGSVSGGPMYYIEYGLGKGWKPMAVFFAICAVICSFGSGNMNQSNTMAASLESFGVPVVASALFFAVMVGLVVIGGIKRIGRVTSFLAPAMAALYVGGALVILAIHIADIPSGLALVVTQAFNPESLVGGGAASFLLTLMWGVRRGLFSNEAGQGSAPIAHAAAKTDEPVREGLVASLGPFIDTLVICTMTGLVIILTGSFKDKVETQYVAEQLEMVLESEAADADLARLRSERDGRNQPTVVEIVDGRPLSASFVESHAVLENILVAAEDGRPWNGRLTVAPSGEVSTPEDELINIRGDGLLVGAQLTSWGFEKALGPIGRYIVTLAVLLFAISTAISWSYYGDRATEYLVGSRWISTYRYVFVFFFFLGAILPLEAVWTFGDVALGLMSFPNLIALVLLSGTVAAMSKDYFSRPQIPWEEEMRQRQLKGD